MNSIEFIDIKKDSSFLILIEAQNRGYEIYYMEDNFLYLKNNLAHASSYLLNLKYDQQCWYTFKEKRNILLSDLDVILIRTDPPVDSQYIYTTYILEHAENYGTLIINKPSSLRNYNEKIVAMNFPQYTPDTLLSCSKHEIFSFLNKHKKIVLKPIDGMGGKSVFKVNVNDPNFSVIFETLTNYGKNFCIAQKYISDVKYGDKRIFIIDGKPVSFCLKRQPSYGEIRANLASGGTGYVTSLSDRDYEISTGISNFLIRNGLIFVGIDVIGNYLTEINITSPTCIREIEKDCNISITKTFFDVIEAKLS